MSRRQAALIVVAIVTALGIPSALSFTSMGLTIGGKPFLDVMDQITGSGIVVTAGIIGAALIAWLFPRAHLFKAMNAHSHRIGPITLSPQWMISVGRYLPAATVALLLVTYLL
jgi:SNF family Na+-dependent transporter